MKSSVAPVSVFHDSLTRTGQSLRRPTQTGSSAKLPETFCASEVRPLINNQIYRFTGVDNQRLMQPLVSITTAWPCLAGIRTGKTMQINPPQAENMSRLQLATSIPPWFHSGNKTRTLN